MAKELGKKPKGEKLKGKSSESADDSVLAKDQEKRGYYYDDAYGYEQYVPEDDSDDGEAEEKK